MAGGSCSSIASTPFRVQFALTCVDVFSPSIATVPLYMRTDDVQAPTPVSGIRSIVTFATLPVVLCIACRPSLQHKEPSTKTPWRRCVEYGTNAMRTAMGSSM